MVLCGDASYGMYLLHIPLWHVAVRCGIARHPGFYPVYLLLVVVAGILSLKYIETPARTRLQSLLSPADYSGSRKPATAIHDGQAVFTATIK
jgi:peptidoglycan/LPS O-acetylase OafA/YrhL